jgi:hypothetical protein
MVDLQELENKRDYLQDLISAGVMVVWRLLRHNPAALDSVST